MKFALKTSHLSTLVFLFLISASVLTFLSPLKVWSYVLPLDFVVKQTISKTGRIPIAIEQEVIFRTDTSSAKVNESWLIEGDRNLKLSAQGVEALKENIRINALYNSKNKTTVLGKNKQLNAVPPEFFQRLLFIRSADAFNAYLQELKISSQVRLSRADGRVCVTIGEPSSAEKASAQIWIDQDEFFIRKIKFSSGATLELSDYTKITQDFYLAKSQKMTWGQFSAEIKVKSFSYKTPISLTQFNPQNFDQNSEINFPEANKLSLMINEFYARFR